MPKVDVKLFAGQWTGRTDTTVFLWWRIFNH